MLFHEEEHTLKRSKWQLNNKIRCIDPTTIRLIPPVIGLIDGVAERIDVHSLDAIGPGGEVGMFGAIRQE